MARPLRDVIGRSTDDGGGDVYTNIRNYVFEHSQSTYLSLFIDQSTL